MTAFREGFRSEWASGNSPPSFNLGSEDVTQFSLRPAAVTHISLWTASTGGTRITSAADGTWVTSDHLCPDLLRLSNIGAADGLRGRVVRAFFWIMKLWPPRR